MKKGLSLLGALCTLSALTMVSCSGLADSGDTNLYADQIITLPTPSLSAELDDTGTSSQVKLRWNYITGAAGFRLVRYDETLNDIDGSVLSASGSTINGTATSYTDSYSLSDGHRYRYELMALSGSGYTAKTVYLKDSGSASVTITYGNLAAAANLYGGTVTSEIDGTARATINFYPNTLVEYRVRLLSSSQTEEITAIASGNTSGTTSWSIDSSYYDGTYEASVTLTDTYDLNTTYHPYFLVRYKDTASFGSDWTYMPVTSSTASDSLTTQEVLEDAGLTSLTMTIDNKTQATVSGSGKSSMSYRVAVVDSLGTSETVAAMKTGDSSGTTEYAALTNSDSTYQAVVSGTYSYNTTYYAVFMVKFTSNTDYDTSSWIYLNPNITDSVSVSELALDAFTSGSVALENNASGGLSLTFPVVAEAKYRYAVLPANKSVTYNNFNTSTVLYTADSDNNAYKISLSSDTQGNTFTSGEDYYLQVYVYSNTSYYDDTYYYAYTQVPSLDVTVYKVSVDTVLAGKTYVSESFAYTLDEDDVAELVASTSTILSGGDTVQVTMTVTFNSNGVNYTASQKMSKDGSVLASEDTSGDYNYESTSLSLNLADGGTYTPTFSVLCYNTAIGDTDFLLYGTSADDVRTVTDANYDDSTSTISYTLTPLTKQAE